MQLQVVNLSTNEELPYWIEQLCTPILWTKVTVDAKDYVTIQIQQNGSQEQDPSSVFEAFVTSNGNDISSCICTYEIKNKTDGFTVTLRTKSTNLKNGDYILGVNAYDFDYLNIVTTKNMGHLAFGYNPEFDHYVAITDIEPPYDGLYNISVIEYDTIDYFATVKDINNIVYTKYHYEEREPELSAWTVKTKVPFEYMYITKHNPLYVKDIVRQGNTMIVKVYNVDDIEYSAQIRIPLPSDW